MTRNTHGRVFDVAVVGGGIGGSMLAAILARNGVRVLLIEAGSHPRFAIGESTVPETTFGLRVLARRYGVPEIENLATHGALKRAVSSACGVKRNFGFVYHREGEAARAGECTQYPTWSPPFGPDSHFFRQDVDAYLMQVALSYGASVYTETRITDVQFGATGVTISTANNGDFQASYLVDAGGIRALIPERLGLREDPPPYRTRSRTIYTHMVDVLTFDSVYAPRAEHEMPSPFSEGTLHHLFPGGWFWIIPFDNHYASTSRLCSVGLNLDLDRYPARPGETAEHEFWRMVARFPSIAQQLAHARQARPFVGSGRLQFASRQVIGERWCLLPHASDFIDPLFSSGLAITVFALNALSHRLISAVRQNDFRSVNFEYVERWTKRMFRYYDDLVSCSYIAFDDFELWNAWHRVWTLGTLYGANAQNEAALAYEETGDPAAFMQLEQAPYRGLQGADFSHYAHLFDDAVQTMLKYRAGEHGVAEARDRIYDLLRASGLSPDVWSILDPSNRCPADVFTLLPMVRLALWGQFRSPPHVRGRYLTGGIRVFAKEAVQQYARELKRDITIAHQFARDMVVNWNRDWAKRPESPRTRAAAPISKRGELDASATSAQESGAARPNLAPSLPATP